MTAPERDLADALGGNDPLSRIQRAKLKRAIGLTLIADADDEEAAAREEWRAEAEWRADLQRMRRMSKRFGGGELGAFVERRV